MLVLVCLVVGPDIQCHSECQPRYLTGCCQQTRFTAVPGNGLKNGDDGYGGPLTIDT